MSATNPIRPKGTLMTMGIAGAVSMTLPPVHWCLWTLSGNARLNELVAPGSAASIVDGYPMTRLLLTLAIAATLVLGSLAVILWRRTHSVARTLLLPLLVLATYTASAGYGPAELQGALREPATSGIASAAASASATARGQPQ